MFLIIIILIEFITLTLVLVGYLNYYTIKRIFLQIIYGLIRNALFIFNVRFFYLIFIVYLIFCTV